ncbi:MAG: acyl carrier protein [Candidatus Calescibacterium sp.]|nr:acyl carrier protein [Candidatus Calescibacterium sp.]MCX7733981.1 acyl carrier protein [bacterium]MDW8086420.1 acyl carrier protein [Candidatus Calescibacterium sp.]
MESIEIRVKSIIAEKLGKKVEDIKDDASFIDDLGADSLDIVDMIMKMEEEFGVSIPDEDLDKIRTVKDAIQYIQARKK